MSIASYGVRKFPWQVDRAERGVVNLEVRKIFGQDEANHEQIRVEVNSGCL
jgi:hypothetical protein